MTFLEMYGEVREFFSNNTVFTTTQSKAYVNRVYAETALQFRFYELESVDATLVTVASTATVAVTSGTRRVILLKDTTNKRVLRFRSLEWMEEQDDSGDVISQPEYFTRFGTNLILWPIPDDVYTLRMRYRKLPTALSADGDTPVFPTEWHGYLVLKAASKAAFKLGLDERAMTLKNEALGLLKEISEDPTEDSLRRLGQLSPQRGRSAAEHDDYAETVGMED